MKRTVDFNLFNTENSVPNTRQKCKLNSFNNNNNNNNINNIYLFTAIWLLPGGSGYFICKQNMKLVTT